MTTITSNVASTYGANAAPLATSIASLGAAIQAGSTNGGNTAVATGYTATPATTGTGAQSATAAATSQAPAAITAGTARVNNMAANQGVTLPTNYVAPANGQVANAAIATLANGYQTNPIANTGPAVAGVGATLANDAAIAAGGGAISSALKSGVSSIVAFAQNGMKNIQAAIQADMAANNGEVDPAKMQLYTMKMSTYELLNQMAAKIQEKEEAAMQRWLR